MNCNAGALCRYDFDIAPLTAKAESVVLAIEPLLLLGYAAIILGGVAITIYGIVDIIREKLGA